MASQVGALKRPRELPGICVDGFNFQSADTEAYILTHFHSDHTTGLTAGFAGACRLRRRPRRAAPPAAPHTQN